MYRLVGKRLFDIVISVIILIVAAPLLGAVAVCLYFSNSGQILFFQPRPGLGGRTFNVIKFKTMTDARGSNGALLPDAQRVTRVGALVRKLSIDELLQLVNVLKGDMSIIGPRPLLVDYLPYYSASQARRHEVRPGITGLAQVKGRNSLSWSRRFHYDVFYVDHCSLALDAQVFVWTIQKVLKADDINHDRTNAAIVRFDDYARWRLNAQSERNAVA